MASFIDKTKNWILKHKLFLICIIVFVMIKVVGGAWASWNEGNLDKDKTDMLQRRNWLTGKIVVEPRQLLKKMPGGLGLQFQGEWALYSCSILTKAGHTIAWYDKRHFLLADIAIVCEAITLAMRTHYCTSN